MGRHDAFVVGPQELDRDDESVLRHRRREMHTPPEGKDKVSYISTILKGLLELKFRDFRFLQV